MTKHENRTALLIISAIMRTEIEAGITTEAGREKNYPKPKGKMR